MYIVKLKCLFSHCDIVKDATYYAHNGNRSSCIDYVLMSDQMHASVVVSYVVWNGINLSPH